MSGTYTIRVFGDPILKLKCTAVESVDSALRQLSKDMLETMYQAPGVGLAAPQIGVGKRMFVYDADDGRGPFTILNPEIVRAEGEWTFEEGCLSVPGMHWPIKRAEEVEVVGTDLDGNEINIVAREFHAKILQHEIDHLDGMLLLQRLEPDLRKQAMRAIRERQLQGG